ncbi:MAG TPA: LuxR C-terminal-related transcriptional regulator [Rubrobacter sp.]|nr:LuxR C-terminal-related transcriptional regulator [Rubrobacter sp.]
MPRPGGRIAVAEIAGELYISEGTAKNNVSKILRKLGLRDRTQLALYAARRWSEERRQESRRAPRASSSRRLPSRLQ